MRSFGKIGSVATSVIPNFFSPIAFAIIQLGLGSRQRGANVSAMAMAKGSKKREEQKLSHSDQVFNIAIAFAGV